MCPIKAVKQSYAPGPEILELLKVFRCMVNDSVKIGLEQNLTSMKSLSLKGYGQLTKYQVHSGYRLTAMSKATGLLNNYRKVLKKNPKAREPYARKLSLVACYGVKVQDGKLRVPIRAGEHVFIPLNPHVLRTLAGFRVRSFSLAENSLSIAYERTVSMIRHIGYMGVDCNLSNVTTASTNLQVTSYDLSETTKIKSKYCEVKRHMKRNDHRVRRQVFKKYGRLQSDKVQQILHHASKMIVEEAKRNQQGIVMEKLTGIRRLYRKGNWQGRNYRAKMNGWSFAEIQRQIDYKAQWEGIPVIYVNPFGTSSKCAKCGCRMAAIPEERRTLRCSKCGFAVDRDVNAALNIATRGLRFSPIVSASEAMRTEPCETQQTVEVIRQVDADELTHGGPTR